MTTRLQGICSGMRIAEIYSQSKDELIIALSGSENTFFINAHLAPDFCCLSFPSSLSRAKKNSVDLFRMFMNLAVVDIVQIENDRSFYFQLDGGFQLLFKMHGKRSNIVGLHEGKVVELFRKNLIKDTHLAPETLSRNIHFSREGFYNSSGDLKTLLPTFGRDFEPYFQKHRYDEKPLEVKFEIVSGLLEYLKNPTYYLHMDERLYPEISLYRRRDNDAVIIEPLAALNALYKAYIIDYRQENEKRSIVRQIDERIRKSEAYLSKSMDKLESLQKESGYARIADLIMANLHSIRPHQSEVELIDFYTQKPAMIKLNPMLSPQLNAERYYRKSRKQQIEIGQLKIQIDEKLAQIDRLNLQKKDIMSVESIKQLKKQSPHVEEKAGNLPFHVVIWTGFEILIGKNARSNEALTFGTAGKDDLFLHAKDVPGSHVIIRAKTKQNFPSQVIEQAAGYAAFYSKSKGERLVSVLYTPKKYVRKAKGMPPGTVIVTNEKVILASPEDFKK